MKSPLLTDAVDLYPTPPALIKRMLDGIDLTTVGAILEPSAGTGNLVTAVKTLLDARRGRSYDDSWRGNRKQPVETTSHGYDIDCVEIDPQLQAILRGAGWRVVHDDFLTYSTHKRYGLILMNPPFSSGAKHLLKALEMQERGGGKIVCVLNAETLRNAFTNERRDLVRRLRDLEASVEYIRDTFTGAERRTDVEVALVKVDIPCANTHSVILEGMRKAREDAESADGAGPQQIVHADYLQGLVERYQFESQAGTALINEYHALKPHILDRIGGEYVKNILTLSLYNDNQFTNDTAASLTNRYIHKIRAKYWSALLADARFTGILTSELRDLYMRKIDSLVDFEFSLFNIYTLRIEFGKLALSGIDKAITDLFEELSHKHHWYDDKSENVHYYNGWKTNKAWKINKKVILPVYSRVENDYGGGLRLSYCSKAMDKLCDVQKVLSYLDGKPTDSSRLIQTIERELGRGRNRGIECGYFSVSLFKKGTCHIVFNNDDLLKKFNLYGSQRKGWLPPSYGRATYADMTPEERDVVDSFEGKAEYAKTLARADFYLPAPEKMLLSIRAA